MYTCERLGENATEFRYAPVDGGYSGGGSGGAWTRAAVAVAGASLFAQVSKCDRRVACSVLSYEYIGVHGI